MQNTNHLVDIKTKIRDLLAHITANWLRHFAFDLRYKSLWERHGFHISAVSFYSPLPDIRQLTEDHFTNEPEIRGIQIDLSSQCSLLEQFENKYKKEYSELHKRNNFVEETKFFLGNPSIGPVDAEILFCMVRSRKPRRIIEIGSGFSTLLTGEALAKNRLEGNEALFVAIEPYPPEFLQKSLPYPLDLKIKKVQEISLEVFKQLKTGDILFIDSSHVVKIGSDVQYEILQILPALAPGVVIHVHDIFLPREYPHDWVVHDRKAWNEQYMLQAFLIGNRDFEVLWAGAMMHHRHPERLKEAFSSYDPAKHCPASFWFQRKDL